MGALIFLAIVVTILIVIIRIIIKLIQGRSIMPNLKRIAIGACIYSIVWVIYYCAGTYKSIPLGSEICFDDWCTTVSEIESPLSLGTENNLLHPNGKFFVLHLKMINEAKRIAQRPSEPRVHIIDEKGTRYAYSETGQQALERQTGVQLPFDSRLELHQSLETELVFDIPLTARNLKVLIEEGPFITTILFDDNKEVFAIP
jgi:hypothetical protein